MAQWHHIFCRSDTALPREELTAHITDSWYGDGLPNVTSAPHGRAWHELILEFPGAPSQRIDLRLDSAPEIVTELVNEFLDEHGEGFAGGDRLPARQSAGGGHRSQTGPPER